MTQDVRAYVYCSLGTVISGALSESSILDAGLVTVSGNVILDGLYTPTRGQVVQLSYYKQGNIGRIGRKLLVLGYQTNPVTRQTDVSLGCRLTYHASTESTELSVKSTETDDDLELSEIDKLAMLNPTNAATIFNYCCNKLGITAASCPLTNQFFREEFDLDGPFVDLMDDLLKSESYVGYMDANDTLQYIYTPNAGGFGPVVTEQEIVDISPTNEINIPADVVFSNVSYRSIKLDAAIDADNGLTDDETNGQTGTQFDFAVQKRSSPYVLTGFDREYIASRRDYRWKNPLTDEEIVTSIYWFPSNQWTAYYDTQGRMYQKDEITDTSWGFAYKRTTVTYTTDGDLEVQTERTVEVNPIYTIIEAVGFPEELVVPLPRWIRYAGNLYLTEGWDRISTRTTAAWPSHVNTSTQEYTMSVFTSDGAQSVKNVIDSFKDRNYYPASNDQNDLVNYALGLATQVVLAKNHFSSETKPPDFSINEGSDIVGWSSNDGTELDELGNANDSDATYVTEVNTTPEVIYNSGAAAGIVLEFTPPYSSDDRIVKVGNKYSVQRSDAQVKARTYARIQNRLRLGQINGHSVVLPIEYVPAKPFDPIYLDFAGIVGQFRFDNASIAFDNTGILFSADCLFWGGVGE